MRRRERRRSLETVRTRVGAGRRPRSGALAGRLRAGAAGLALLAALGAPAAAQQGALGLAWGTERSEVLARTGAIAGTGTLHELYGEAVDLEALPVVLGGELTRIAYFGDDERLLRVWVNFGLAEGRVWERHFELEQAVVKYREVKRFAEGRWEARGCREPELRMVEAGGGRVLAPAFEVRRDVWSCRYARGATRARVALRRLGDPERRRFDVLLDARDAPAVERYRARQGPRFGLPGQRGEW